MHFTLTANKDWKNEDASFSNSEPFFAVSVHESRSRFDKSFCMYHVIADGLSASHYRTSFVIKSFKSKTEAENFAAKLVKLLNEEDFQ